MAISSGPRPSANYLVAGLLLLIVGGVVLAVGISMHPGPSETDPGMIAMMGGIFAVLLGLVFLATAVRRLATGADLAARAAAQPRR